MPGIRYTWISWLWYQGNARHTLDTMTTQADRALSSPDSPTIAPAASATPPQTLSTAGLAVLLCSAFLPALDFFIVNVALPTIDSTLHGSAPMLELVVAGYGTAYALLLIIGGRLGDTYGRRTVLSLGLAGFVITSLVCGIAPNIDLLVGARIIQGVSAAMIVPQVLATFHATLEGHPRSRALGLYGAANGTASAAGLMLGGLLVTANIAGSSWRPIFLVNVPVGLIVLLLIRRTVPNTRSASPASVDLRGTALLAVTVVALLVPLTEGATLGWPLWTWLVLALSPVAAVATYVVELRTERSGGAPLLPPSLLRLRSMSRGLALGLPFFLGFGGFMFVFALTVQDGLHQDALHSGLAITPLAVTFVGGSLLVPRLITRYGRAVIAAGSALQALALVWLVLLVVSSWPHVSLLMLAPSLALAGFGQSLVFGSLFRLVLADVPARLAGVGGGVVITLQQTGLALGVSTLGTLFISLRAHSVSTAFGVVIGIQAVLAVLVTVGAMSLPKARPASKDLVVET
jgi:MFS family permease